MFEIEEKAKRKAKPHQSSRLFRGLVLLLSLIFLIGGLFAVGVLTGVIRRPISEFEYTSTQIALTNVGGVQIDQTVAQTTASYFMTQTKQASNTATQIAATRAASTVTPRP